MGTLNRYSSRRHNGFLQCTAIDLRPLDKQGPVEEYERFSCAIVESRNYLENIQKLKDLIEILPVRLLITYRDLPANWQEHPKDSWEYIYANLINRYGYWLYESNGQHASDWPGRITPDLYNKNLYLVFFQALDIFSEKIAAAIPYSHMHCSFFIDALVDRSSTINPNPIKAREQEAIGRHNRIMISSSENLLETYIINGLNQTGEGMFLENIDSQPWLFDKLFYDSLHTRASILHDYNDTFLSALSLMSDNLSVCLSRTSPHYSDHPLPSWSTKQFGRPLGLFTATNSKVLAREYEHAIVVCDLNTKIGYYTSRIV